MNWLTKLSCQGITDLCITHQRLPVCFWPRPPDASRGTSHWHLSAQHVPDVHRPGRLRMQPSLLLETGIFQHTCYQKQRTALCQDYLPTNWAPSSSTMLRTELSLIKDHHDHDV
jgi:hypothetical protein